MIVAIAHRSDEIARELVAHWAGYGAGLLTCEDLSMEGWYYCSSEPENSTAVVGGNVVAVGEIAGVLIRMPGVLEQELFHIVPVDRAYVAMEMTSFLIAWLSGIKCPVLNRPTPLCLSGPCWRREQWVYAAAQVGIPVRPARRHVALSTSTPPEVPNPDAITVTVVGNHCFGLVDKALAVQARQLADAAQVDLLTVQFSGPEPGSCFIGANLWPDLTADDIADAVLQYLLQPPIKGL